MGISLTLLLRLGADPVSIEAPQCVEGLSKHPIERDFIGCLQWKRSHNEHQRENGVRGDGTPPRRLSKLKELRGNRRLRRAFFPTTQLDLESSQYFKARGIQNQHVQCLVSFPPPPQNLSLPLLPIGNSFSSEGIIFMEVKTAGWYSG